MELRWNTSNPATYPSRRSRGDRLSASDRQSIVIPSVRPRVAWHRGSPAVPPLRQIRRSSQAAPHQNLTQRRRVCKGSCFPRLPEAALLVQRNRGPVSGRGPEIEVLSRECPRPFRHVLHEGGANASPTLGRVDEHRDQHRRMIETIRVTGDACRHADETAGLLGNERRAILPGSAASSSLMPGGFGKRLFASQGGAEGHRRLGQGTQTNLPESETFVRAYPSYLDRRAAGPHAIIPSTSVSKRPVTVPSRGAQSNPHVTWSQCPEPSGFRPTGPKVMVPPGSARVG